MNDDQRKRLITLYIGECWHDGYWYCGYCGEETSPARVTYTEKCDTCGQYVAWVNNRTFATWDDLGAVKEKLVEKGDWRDFINYAHGEFIRDNPNCHSMYGFDDWLFRPIDENGKPHFCRIVAEWLV
jgi:hypothetical protein